MNGKYILSKWYYNYYWDVGKSWFIITQHSLNNDNGDETIQANFTSIRI
jgi:hypothetical protein